MSYYCRSSSQLLLLGVMHESSGIGGVVRHLSRARSFGVSADI